MRPVIGYGAEAWTFNTETIKRLGRFFKGIWAQWQ